MKALTKTTCRHANGERMGLIDPMVSCGPRESIMQHLR